MKKWVFKRDNVENIINGQHSTSVNNGYISMMERTMLTNDERSWRNEENDEWRKVTMKTKTLMNEENEEIINGHEWNIAMTYSTIKVKRKHALKDKIIGKKCHDEKMITSTSLVERRSVLASDLRAVAARRAMPYDSPVVAGLGTWPTACHGSSIVS